MSYHGIICIAYMQKEENNEENNAEITCIIRLVIFYLQLKHCKALELLNNDVIKINKFTAHLLVLLFHVVNSAVLDLLFVGRQCSDWPPCAQVLVCSEFRGRAKWSCGTHDRHSRKGNYNNMDGT